MKTLRMYPSSINDRYMQEVVDALRAGEIVIYPTDTLYALGCDALNNSAIEKICRIKELNPQKTSLSIICHDISQAAEYARIDNRAFKMLREYLPGPFTFILPASTTLPKVFKGRKAVGVRIPDNAIALAIVEQLGNPVLTTSIEYNDPDEGISPDSIAMRYDDVATLMVDGGDGGIVPSTVIDITDSSFPDIVREGLGVFNG